MHHFEFSFYYLQSTEQVGKELYIWITNKLYTHRENTVILCSNMYKISSHMEYLHTLSVFMRPKKNYIEHFSVFSHVLWIWISDCGLRTCGFLVEYKKGICEFTIFGNNLDKSMRSSVCYVIRQLYILGGHSQN